MNKIHMIPMFFSMLVLGGCYYDIEEELYPSNFCDVENVTFSGIIKPLVQTKCTVSNCHVSGGTAPHDLTNDLTLKQLADDGKIQARVVDKIPLPMPPGGLPNCEIQQVQAWLDAGAPINN